MTHMCKLKTGKRTRGQDFTLEIRQRKLVVSTHSGEFRIDENRIDECCLDECT